MIYNEFRGEKLSALGMGAMRFPVIDGDDSKIDVEKADEMIAFCMKNGINYYDTAYAYHGKQSEIVLGEILKKYDRNSFYLASKFPGFDESYMARVKEIFEEQLKKCQVEYFDFYLFHNVCEGNIDGFLDPKYGVFDYLMEQKKNGRIKHLGFSTHGSIECMERFLQNYGNDMEFCQIELNYIDYHFQDAKGKIELLDRYNIPIWVMEPVRGGELTKVESEAEAKLKALRPDESVVSWAFRFIQSIPTVKMTLSGMSNMQQLQENIDTFGEIKPLNEAEMAAILEIADEKIKKNTVPCTSCRYCTSKCPMNIDIPRMFKILNESKISGNKISKGALGSVEEEKRPDKCIACKSCEKVCPQQIKISEEMKVFVSRM